MNGQEAIINKIIKDAQKVANSTLEEGGQKAQQIINAAENDARLYRAKNRQESEKEREDILRRRITVANLEVKKLLLAAKQEIISRAFAESVDAVRADSEGYKKLLYAMLSYAEDGDVLTVSERDKAILTNKLVDEFATKKGISLALNKSYGSFCGGILLSGKGLDKNLTLEVELASLRDEIEPEIAATLFGE
ncbi:MAG: V-type ATP synthase subunit E family protein [Clostridia bacterium]|nr:V-type ATP synthase subunit E family protein [Clostridia bacterium]